MKDKKADPYRTLIKRFLAREITDKEFEREYLQLFKNETTHFSPEIFEILDILFGDIDMYCADDNLRGDKELNEAQLRLSCKNALAHLSIAITPTR